MFSDTAPSTGDLCVVYARFESITDDNLSCTSHLPRSVSSLRLLLLRGSEPYITRAYIQEQRKAKMTGTMRASTAAAAADTAPSASPHADGLNLPETVAVAISSPIAINIHTKSAICGTLNTSGDLALQQHEQQTRHQRSPHPYQTLLAGSFPDVGGTADICGSRSRIGRHQDRIRCIRSLELFSSMGPFGRSISFVDIVARRSYQ